MLCEACGFDTIIVETVGVGQSEMAVHSMVDFFLLLKLAGAGDELQGRKRGIMEAADAVVIHKADGENMKAARRAKTDFYAGPAPLPAQTRRMDTKGSYCFVCRTHGNTGHLELIVAYVEKNHGIRFFSTKTSAAK